MEAPLSKAQVMHDDYNESVGDWSMESIKGTLEEYKVCVAKMHRDNPQRFRNTDVAFTIAEFGCATGVSSTLPIATIIEEVRKIQPDMPITVYLNDMPDNHHALAIQTVTKGLEKYKDIFLHVAGQDFSTQVFPSDHIDFAFSNMTANILPEAPVNLENNLFFLAAPETLASDWGKKWVAAFDKHWNTFVSQRSKELRSKGTLLVTVLIYDDPIISYERKEFDFFHAVTHTLLKEVLAKYNLSSSFFDVLKTSSSMLKSHYSAAHGPLKDKITEVSMTDFVIGDVFAEEYEKTGDAKVLGEKVANYMKGWWAGVMEGGLLSRGIDAKLAKEVVTDFFDEQLPAFVATKADIYPEKYKMLSLIMQKI